MINLGRAMPVMEQTSLTEEPWWMYPSLTVNSSDSDSWSSSRCMVKAPHWTELAWKFPFSTCRYLVLTVWDLKRLKSATFVPEAIQRSAFFKLCFFLEGFEITFILLEWKTPISVPFP